MKAYFWNTDLRYFFSRRIESCRTYEVYERFEPFNGCKF